MSPINPTEKYVVLQGDGMGDHPSDALDGKTPLEAARTPHMDELAQRGELGRVRTIPDGLPAGSDVGNMSIMGYDPRQYYTGRAALEAASMGVVPAPGDLMLRCNLVQLAVRDEDRVMADYSADHLPTDRGRTLIGRIAAMLSDELFSFYPGVSYRHLMIWRGGADRIDPGGLELTPPHNIPDQPIEDYLPQGRGAKPLRELIERSWEILDGEEANSIWFWGAGTPPDLPPFRSIHGLTGVVISAVDLIKGLAIYADLEPISVPGATGYLDTNYAGKVEAALAHLEERDLAYVHIEAPDETSHEGDLEKKLQAIEAFDANVVAPILDGLGAFKSFAALILTDHYTPVQLQVHTADPVPYLIYRSRDANADERDRGFNERSAAESPIYLTEGHRIMERLLG
ncbi:MAG: cofactor-independent phosphoglycerate mutase [Candidatus Bipolaricaulia bacterium]